MTSARRNRIAVDDEDWKAHVEGRITGVETSVEALKVQVAGVSTEVKASATAIFSRIENLANLVSDSRAINWPLVVSMIVGSVAVLGAGGALYKSYVDMTVLPLTQSMGMLREDVDKGISTVYQKFADDRENWLQLRQEQLLRRDQAIEFNSKRLDLLEHWAQEYRDRNESGDARQWEKLNNIERELFGSPDGPRTKRKNTPDVGSGVSK